MDFILKNWIYIFLSLVLVLAWIYWRIGDESETTHFRHLDPWEAGLVESRLRERGLWVEGEMALYESVLVTTTARAREAVMGILEEMNLLPEGE